MAKGKKPTLADVDPIFAEAIDKKNKEDEIAWKEFTKQVNSANITEAEKKAVLEDARKFGYKESGNRVPRWGLSEEKSLEIDPNNGLVMELDLSDYLQYEVKGTPFGWKNDINSLSEIVGLKYLKNLKRIDLSNNQIKHVMDLIYLKNLQHVVLINNKISEEKNLEYLKKLPKLEFLDLRDNMIAKKTQLNEFNPKIRVILKDYIILK